MLAAAQALDTVYRVLERRGASQGIGVPLYTPDTMHCLMGFEEVLGFREEWGRGPDLP